MKFEMIAPTDLRPNSWNPNHVDPENADRLRNSMKRLGTFKPIVVRETEEGLEILGGQHRWQIAKEEGLAELPIVNLGPMDDQKAKEIALIDNHRYGEDDVVELSEVLRSLDVPFEELMSFMPASEADLESIMSSSTDIDDELLGLEDDDEDEPDPHDRSEKVSKTHRILRFNVSLDDAERITDLIERTQREQGFTEEDEKTNAGDALTHILFSGDS